MKNNQSTPTSLRGENDAIIIKGNHARIYPGELRKVQTLEEIKSLQKPGNIVTFLAPSRSMQEAGREAIGDESILVMVSELKKVQYMTRQRLTRILDMHGDENFKIGEIAPSMSDEIYERKTREIQEHIKNGDICQAVLARHFTSPILETEKKRTSLSLLARLLQIQGTYMTALFHTTEASYLYASPERHLTIKNGKAEVNPIAGTMKIEPETFFTDLEKFAIKDIKEARELTMLIDEGIKMIAEFCPHGHIEGPFLRETGAVIHTEYRISGEVVNGTHVIDALRKTLNAPTLTGSPIDKACEIIAKIEGITRGYYGGVFGVYRNRGNIDTAIAIRGLAVDHETGTCTQTGGAGITLLSDPQSEAQETYNKILGVRRVITGIVRSKNLLGPLKKKVLEREMRNLRNVDLNSFLLQQRLLQESAELIGKKVTVINFDDNFAHILGVIIQSLGAEVSVVNYKNYVPSEDILVLGGGPGDINDFFDEKMNTLRRYIFERGDAPLLGICLGCQAICQYLGLEVRKLSMPLQGIQEEIKLDEKKEKVGHYNSFAGFGRKKGCEILKKTDGSIEMIYSKEQKMLGVQFHPESVMTKNGGEIIKNLLLKLIT